MTLEQAVRAMREAQKRYFKSRDLADLTASKRLEKAVDDLLDPPKPPPQGKLFR
ncbi:MAG: hypothetical protein NVS3B10_29260 [Polyangiales bacterium]